MRASESRDAMQMPQATPAEMSRVHLKTSSNRGVCFCHSPSCGSGEAASLRQPGAVKCRLVAAWVWAQQLWYCLGRSGCSGWGMACTLWAKHVAGVGQGEARGGSFPVRAVNTTKATCFKEKIPGHHVVSLFGCWHSCGLIFDQIHTNERPNTPGARR